MRKKFFLLIIVCLVMGAGVMAQTSTVSGTVFAEDNNEPIIGASVLVKGTTLGAVTDIEGKFTILNVPGTAKTVIVSFVGMQKVEAAIKPAMKVVLKSDSELLDEVMVVAYGTAKKSSYAGSASLVKADALKDIPTTSFENALNGKVAGLQLTNNSGQAGSAPAIRIRGIGSMNAGNEPLYVVDGVPVSSGNTGQMSGELYSTNNIMNTLNPEDIESISVLKDAAASSLYGSRAANGVILITTKKGQIGKPVVTLKAEVGFTPCWATDNYETASVQENVNMLYTVFHDARTSGKGETDEKAAAYAIGQLNSRFNKHGYQFTTNGTGAYENVNILEYDNSGRGGKYYDWDKAYFRTAIYQTYDMSVSGATQNTNYYTSLSYTQDEGRLKMNSFDRVSGRLNLTQKVGKFLELTTNASLARTKKSGYNDTRNTGSNYFMQTRNLLWGLYWPTDYKTGELWTERYGSYAYNGLYYDKEWENGSTSTKIMAAETLTLHLMPGLDLRSIYSYDNTTVKDHIYYSANHYKGSADNGNVNEYRTTYEKMVTSTTANYTGTFDKHTVGTMVGFEAEKNKTDYVRATGSNLAVSTIHTVSTAGTQTSAGYSWGNSMVSVLSKLDYNYDERYFISGSYRRDGSSAFSYTGNQWQNFYSVGLGWLMSEEEWMKGIEWLDMLKLKGSWGTLGNQNLDRAYPAEPLLSNAYSAVFGTPSAIYPGYQLAYLPNPNLRWEKVEAWEVGAEANFFRNRLHFEGVYYKKKTKDLLAEVPGISGTVPGIGNLGSIENLGVELALSWRDQIGDWNYNVGANLTTIKNKVLSLVQDGYSIIAGDKSQSYTMAGYPIGYFYGYKVEGVYQTQEEINNSPKNTLATVTPGDLKFKDVNGDGEITTADRTMIGDPTPNVTYGITLGVGYKNWELAVDMMGQGGNQIYRTWDNYNWSQFNFMAQRMDRWHGEGTSNTQPLLNTKHTINNMNSEYYIEDGSFFRIRNVSLAYNFDKALISKIGMQALKLYVNIQNLKTWKHNTGYTPELGGSAIAFGVDDGSYPMPAIYTFGFNLTF